MSSLLRVILDVFMAIIKQAVEEPWCIARCPLILALVAETATRLDIGCCVNIWYTVTQEIVTSCGFGDCCGNARDA